MHEGGSVVRHPVLTAVFLIACACGASGQTVILDTYGFWRIHHTLQPPVIRDDAGRVRPVVFGYEWLDCETPAPPSGWAEAGFDDSSWMRGPAHMSCHTPYLSRLCLRGYFSVDNPSRAGTLSFSASFSGGMTVFLNGTEIARRYVAERRQGLPALAEPYPAEAFIGVDGKILRSWNKKMEEQDAESQRRIGLRTRELKDLVLPAHLLRRGVNVLAVEIVRAPYPAAVETGSPPRGSWVISTRQSVCEFPFNTCELIGIQLVSSSPTAETAAVRAGGVRLWNSDVLAGDFDLDFGGQSGEPLYPVRIVAPRNGSFSGKFVIGSTEEIRNPRVEVSDLVCGNARIPASCVSVRYGLPWGSESCAFGALMGGYEKGQNISLTYRYSRRPNLLGMLAESPPDSVRVSSLRSDACPPDPRIPPPPAPVPGAVLPVWLTVRVPKEAVPGVYTGTAAVEVNGARAGSVEVSVTVCAWTAPDPAEVRTWIDMIQSPDTLAVEYGVPLWSDRHWNLIGRSMDLLAGVRNRVLYVPLIAQCNHGNAETMVRWIDRGGGTYERDFSVMEKYLDLCLAHMGKPDIVVLYVWDIYLGEYKQLKPGFDENEIGRDKVAAREALKGKGPMVTVCDPRTGEVETRHLPPFSDPASRDLWRGLFEELKPRLASRGLADRVLLGTMSDGWPSKADADFFADVAGNIRWFSDAHMGVEAFKRDMESIASGKASPFTLNTVYPFVKDATAELSVLARVGYSATVWGITLSSENPTGESRFGWRNPQIVVQHDRHGNVHPMARWRYMPEVNILGGQRGVGRLGGDWWSCVRSRSGARAGTVRDRYPHASWRNLDMNIQMLAPGPDGPVATHRFENLREGVWECEARIFVEEALADPAKRERLGPDLASHAEEILRKRANFVTKACSNLQMCGVEWDMVTNTRGFYVYPNTAGHAWMLSAGWMRMNEELFTVAGLVQQRLAAPQEGAPRNPL